MGRRHHPATITLVAALFLTTSAAAALPAGADRGAAAPGTIVRTVTHHGTRLALVLTPVRVRAPGFSLSVQQPGGTFRAVGVPRARAYLGRVRGRPAAAAAGVIDPHGRFDGQVVLARGATWVVRDGRVVEVRAPSVSFRWPTSGIAEQTRTVTPGEAGSTSYRWDLGLDLSHAWFTDPGTVHGSVSEAVSLVDQATVELLLAYESNARLRPAVRRVLVRADPSTDPYEGAADALGVAGAVWRSSLDRDLVDVAAVLRGVDDGAGVAYAEAAGTADGVAAVGGTGDPDQVLRHELGHSWGADDDHSHRPEGPTINSGNVLSRWDGTELHAFFRYRDRLRASGRRLVAVRPLEVGLPPHAALDLRDGVRSGQLIRLRPLANDFDANSDRIRLDAVAGRSGRGGQVRRAGAVVSYRAPRVAHPGTLDRIVYRIRDSTGRTATGVILLRVGP